MFRKRIDISTERAIELFNKYVENHPDDIMYNHKVFTNKKLSNLLDGYCTVTVNIKDINEEEAKELEGANFWGDNGSFNDSLCLLGQVDAENDPGIYWIGEC
jgi:ribosomal protein S17E